jgi:hypothetical protein
MNILLIAPEPFYEDRGTPIAVALILRGLSERGDQVDVITYHQGTEINYEHIAVHRICNLPFICNIRPGFSWKKLVCDIFLFIKALRLISEKRFDLIHAVEEAVFMALILKWFYRIPYVYDMDSSMSQQLVEKYSFLTPFRFFFKYLEKLAVKNAMVVMPVCDALAIMIAEHMPKKVAVVPDVSLLTDLNRPS